jgi:hypothetical protein
VDAPVDAPGAIEARIRNDRSETPGSAKEVRDQKKDRIDSTDALDNC